MLLRILLASYPLSSLPPAVYVTSLEAMNTTTETNHTCDACGRSFLGIGPLNYHLRSCRQGKRRLQGALLKVHQVWQEKMALKKRRKLNPHPDPYTISEVHNPLVATGSSIQDDIEESAAPVSQALPRKQSQNLIVV